MHRIINAHQAELIDANSHNKLWYDFIKNVSYK